MTEHRQHQLKCLTVSTAKDDLSKEINRSKQLGSLRRKFK